VKTIKSETVGLATSSAPRNRLIILLAAASLPLLLVAALLPRTFFDSDSGAKYLQARAIQGRAGWPKTIPYPGSALDPDGRYVPACMHSEGNEAVSIFPVLFPIAAAAGLVAGQDTLWRLVPLAAGLLAVYLAGRLGAVAGSGAGARALIPVCLLATPVFFYSVVFTEHTAAAAAVLGALLLVAERSDTNFATARWAGFGFVLGLAVWLRTETFVILPLGCAPLLWCGRGRWRSALAGAGGVAAGLVLGSAVQRVVLGLWLPAHVFLSRFRSWAIASPLPTRRLTLSLLYAPDPWTGAALIVWLAALFLMLVPRFRHATWVRGLACVAFALALWATFGMPSLRWLAGAKPTVAFHYEAAVPVWAVLAALPVALSGAQPAVGVRRARTLLGVTAALYVVGCLLALPMHGEYQWGPRYLLPGLLLLVVLMLTAPAAEPAWERVRRSLIAGAICAGLAVQCLGIVLLFRATGSNAGLTAAVLAATRPGEVVISTTPVVPLLAAASWTERVFLVSPPPSLTSALLGRLSAARVTAWTFIDVEGLNDCEVVPAASVGVPGGAAWDRETEHSVRLPNRIAHIYRYRVEREARAEP
jgi:hypothetical protein